MAIPAGVARVSLQGHLGQGEIFDTGFWVEAGDINTAAEANDLAADVAADFETQALAVAVGYLDGFSGYDRVRVYAYPTGGPNASYVGEAPIANGAGVNSGPQLPLQCCIVVSLRTPLAGRRSRGRMYIPINQGTLTTHQLTLAQCQAMADAFGNFFETVNDTAANREVVVVSQVGTGGISNVDRVTVDSLVDIQRRRANDQTELYNATSPVGP